MKTKISDADAMARLEELDPATVTVRDSSVTTDVETMRRPHGRLRLYRR